MARSGYTPMASRRAAWKTPFAVSAPRPSYAERCKNYDAVVMWMSRERATSLERCRFASRRDRRMERLCSPERSTMARWNVCWSIGGCLHRNAPETPRTLSTVELGVHKLSPGILTHEYCRPERTIATTRCHERAWGFESGARRRERHDEMESGMMTALSKVE